MKHNENSRFYEADDGKMLVRVSDGKVVGDSICLGDDDDISNYKEHKFTDKQRAQFFKDIGQEDPKKIREEMRKEHEERRKRLDERRKCMMPNALKTREQKKES